MVGVGEDTVDLQHLMRINVGDKRLRDKKRLILVGSCMDRFPEIIKEYSEEMEDAAVLHICLEESHINQAGFKIGSIVRYSGIEKIAVLTVDGSPHCVQLHFVVEDVKRHFTPEIEITHYVVEKGKIHEISSQAVKTSRHLSKVQRMLDAK
ncbi:4Fe-4S ferredoxin [Candidatus Thorarchaeota archaeon]|jgi:hypothetical protein|nr:MAG: 4Fe-4S ferredoxin [Candidatus Thorarchaeota archaeon]